MDERTALSVLADRLGPAGDDAAVVEDLVVTIDMLHASTDFPDETTRYTAGWRAVGASLSDIAAMGADPVAAVAVYAAPSFESEQLLAFVDGAIAVCEAVGGEYVGGDLDENPEFSAVTAAIGRTDDPVFRSGTDPGDVVCVTGTLGRSAAALALFADGQTDRANDLFRFDPRVASGRTLAPFATAMMDSSDGLARSLHQLAEASDVGIAVESPLPIDETVEAVASNEDDRREMGVFFGEDFELVCTIDPDDLAAARRAVPISLSPIGRVVDGDAVTLDGEALADRGFTHGGSD
ncbi:thiamine-phosphate kinase [Halorhabdus rudnickae]|uniref:thiamine-phosphate kinase n=1 Tax=Halorhabdus rudnickae TaxID=1775544 RepID=UPI0010844920|nr:thiamine-phosphate kinase [Halorhabdus rudnickae]